MNGSFENRNRSSESKFIDYGRVPTKPTEFRRRQCAALKIDCLESRVIRCEWCLCSRASHWCVAEHSKLHVTGHFVAIYFDGE